MPGVEGLTKERLIEHVKDKCVRISLGADSVSMPFAYLIIIFFLELKFIHHSLSTTSVVLQISYGFMLGIIQRPSYDGEHKVLNGKKGLNNYN